MYRKCMLALYGLTLAMVTAPLALGQSSLLNRGSQSGGSAATSLNQMALRNAQQAMQQSYSQSSGMPSAGRIGLGLDTSYSGAKPFSNFSQGPAVSPYLNLFRVDQNGFKGFNYSTLVQPQLRQQQFNQQQQVQNKQVSGRLQAISAQADFNSAGSKEEFPTGDQTVFQYTGHYYPQQQRRQKKQAR